MSPVGDGEANVGNGGNRNSYRGMYWTGETRKVCGGSVRLTPNGDLSALTYRVSVWSVDLTDNLKLVSELAYININGSDIISGFNDFTFDTPITVITGAAVILISREDVGTESAVNFINVWNSYDESDLESKQWNIHYHSNGDMAGRDIGDEDQPEYFTCDWKLTAYNETIAANLEYPNMPEDIMTSEASSTSVLIEWEDRSANNVVLDYYNIYSYNTSTGVLTLVDTSETTSYTHEGLSLGTYTYVVTAVSTSGNEGYHSLMNGTNWQTTLS